MKEAVSDILMERARVDDGMRGMFAVSLAAHAALLALAVVMPANWGETRPEPVLMTISLGGTTGPESTGMTTISERPVQSIAEPDAKPLPELPPATKLPEMTEPTPVAKPTPKPVKPTAKPVERSPSRRPTVGEEITAGDAKAKTGGAAIPFGGLAQGGGGTGGMQIDVQDFCCPDYIQTMVQRIRQNWNPNQGAAATVGVKFTIRRDGMLTLVEVEKPSGQAMLDLESRRAVLMTRQLPPLPREFTEPHLTIHVIFTYRR